MFSWISIN